VSDEAAQEGSEGLVVVASREYEWWHTPQARWWWLLWLLLYMSKRSEKGGGLCGATVQRLQPWQTDPPCRSKFTNSATVCGRQ
jgi:hypothetical protein